MTQRILPNRKHPEFRCCTVCEVEFYVRYPDQQWCSLDCANSAKRGVDPIFREMKRREREADHRAIIREKHMRIEDVFVVAFTVAFLTLIVGFASMFHG